VKIAGALYPVVTLLVITSTANHFVLDAAGGVGALTVAFGIQRLLFGRSAFAVPEVEPVQPDLALVQHPSSDLGIGLADGCK
jgi:hypothetical protein